MITFLKNKGHKMEKEISQLLKSIESIRVQILKYTSKTGSSFTFSYTLLHNKLGINKLMAKANSIDIKKLDENSQNLLKQFRNTYNEMINKIYAEQGNLR